MSDSAGAEGFVTNLRLPSPFRIDGVGGDFRGSHLRESGVGDEWLGGVGDLREIAGVKIGMSDGDRSGI